MKNLFSIGDVSKIKNITIKALRYYHKMGILVPRYIDESTGYRYYSIDQFINIDVIKGCRALGTSISELQEIFKESNTDKLLEFLSEKRAQAEENIVKMQEIIKNIDMLNESVQYSKEVVRSDEIEIRYFKKRYIVVAPCKESGSLKELLYYSNLDKVIVENNIETNMDKGIMYNIKSNGEVQPLYVFSGIKNDTSVEENKHIRILPEGNYLVLSYNKENEEERTYKIIDYAQRHNLTIRSFIELELFDDLFNIDTYSCQIQFLVDHNLPFEQEQQE